ncbi:hypothetical protein [Sphingobacterium corticibacter]|uniref:Uncharacterized protein n=1 Tax=Sphingobacterium corticibacter TaxID=2171749 RepID=A0A2T8HIS7_9SPHI|nr:hypothetical protein [Sphingobacterium corticibacter]PVH25349.1 hypothetical protein DC487_10550 [Sphingobacterium corticibacter]
MIPEHKKGKRVDCSSSAEFSTTEEAKEFFLVAKERLLGINDWNEVAVLPSSVFQLADSKGAHLEREAQEGDLVKIDILGPGLPSSDGYDWVRIEQILEEIIAKSQKVSITLRPTTDPTQPNEGIAHFFKNIATSTIVLEQQDKEVSAQYAGRNELINDENEGIADTIRNALIGLGVKLGGSYPQWKALVAGLVQKD